jgi:hypothetical protein
MIELSGKKIPFRHQLTGLLVQLGHQPVLVIAPAPPPVREQLISNCGQTSSLIAI